MSDAARLGLSDRPAGTDGATAGRRSSRSSRRRTPPAVIWAIVATSAVVAAFADAAPTGHGVADALWRGAAGAIVPLLATDARRWTWFPLAGVAAAVGRGLFGLAAGVSALALAFAAGFAISRRRWMGAAVGALSVQALLHGVTYGPLGTPTAVAIAAVAPVTVSALRHASPRLRRSLIGGAVIAVVVVGVLSVFTAVSAVGARDRIVRALDLGDEAATAAEDGDTVLAGSLVGAAGAELDAIADDFSAPWLAPARFVPVLGQHAGALRDLSAAGGQVAAAASDVLTGVDPDILLPRPGNVDVGAVRALVAPMNDLRRDLGAAIVTIQDIDDTWVLPLAADRIDEVGQELTGRFDTVTAADDILGSLPGLLGGDGLRRYLVVFMTPAEARAAGGFAGNWAEVVAADGRIAVVDAGRGNELNDAVGPAGVTLPDDIDVALHDGFRITEVFQNVTAIVDFPAMARTAAAWYGQATGKTVDGVIGVDPDAMAGLVRLGGPVTLGDRTFDAGSFRDFVLRGQYIDFEDDNAGREDILEELTFGVFETLVTNEPPTPAAVIDVMGPLVERDSIRMISTDDTENDALRSTGLTDDFPRPAGQDLLAVITQNLSENKIDTFLERDVTYEATVDPATGAVTARLVVTLTNTAPAEGLPDAIIANNDLGFRLGTNRSRLQIYTPLGLVGATIAGETVPMVPEVELGWNRFRRDVFIDAGSSVTLTVDLAGTVDVTDGYILEVDNQPLANPDRIQLAITPTDGWATRTTSGLDASGRGNVTGDRDQVMGSTFSRTDGP